MKLNTAFVLAQKTEAGSSYLLPFRLVSAQDAPRAGASALKELLVTAAFTESGGTPTLEYKPGAGNRSFTANFEFLQSDQTIQTRTIEPGTISDGSPNPFARNKPVKASLTIAPSSPTTSTSSPYRFTVRLTPGPSFTLNLNEVGELWMGLGSAAGGNTQQVGWVLAFGTGFAFKPQVVN